MANGLKSVVLAAGIMFLYFVVLGGEIPPRRGWIGGGRGGVTFCDGWLADVPVLDPLPCFVLNLTIIVATFLAIIGAFAAVRLTVWAANR